VSCAKCGYALYRTSTRSSARAIHYYRCLGSDAWRRLSGSDCNNRPVRQDLLDEVVWGEVVRLLENPQLIQSELERRLAAAREADPTKRHEEALRRELVRIRKSIDRLLTYAEGNQLSAEQIALMKSEMEPSGSRNELMAGFVVAFAKSGKRIRAFSPGQLEEERKVGKKQLPTTVGGLLVHVADHTQRHVGQAITTAKVIGWKSGT